ncbi:amidase [Kineococcus aurantiacus]|uniref:Amidase n=1 Tax=Kineococcus aurantiacus TaxID=37633 RepID=A0A7Y9DMF0_9ACTN|nr:amidase [Kineococcus aurantiacus]
MGDELALLASGRAGSVDLVREHLARAAAHDDDSAAGPGLRALVAVDPAAGRHAARLDAERAAGTVRGPLHGVPLVVKDNIATGDLPTSAGSAALATYRPRDAAVVVRRLRRAGALVLATTNLSELSWHGTFTRSSVRGLARNPHDRRLSTSGSSGGTAAAVAAGFAPAGLGTDSCGSVLGPAAHQGLVGFRPTRGTVPLDGVVPLSPRQDAVGPLATSVADAALLASVLAADPSLAPPFPAGALRGKRIGWFPWEPHTGPAAAPVDALVHRALGDLAARGAHVVEVPFTPGFAARLADGGWLDVRASLDAFLGTTPARWPDGLAELTAPHGRLTLSDVVADGRSTVPPDVLATWLALPDVPNPAYDAAVAAQDTGRRLLGEFFAAHDLAALAMPTATAPATPDRAGTAFCGVTANTGFPAVTVPAGSTPEGLPVGLQLVAPPGADAALLALAHDYEQATGHHRPPPGFG